MWQEWAVNLRQVSEEEDQPASCCWVTAPELSPEWQAKRRGMTIAACLPDPVL